VWKSAIKPDPHDPDLPVPQPQTEKEDTLFVDERASTDTESEEDIIESDPSFQRESAPFLINHERLNDLVRDLYPSKEKADVLGFRLQQWNLLETGTTISSFRNRNENLARYYASAENICCCKNVDGLMTELGCEHNPVHWRLFIDSSKASLKAVLLHNGYIKPSIPVGYSILRKETYHTMKILLDLLEYSKYNWKVCSYLKVVSLLLGLQYTKHMCFLCLWNSWQDSSHYAVKVWPPRQSPQIGRHNVQHQPLVSSANVFLPPLHINLGLMKNFVKAKERDGDDFKFLKDFFGADKSDAKLKAGVFMGPEIRKLMLNEEFDSRLKPLELAAWNALKSVVANVLGNHRRDQYADIVDRVLKVYEQLGALISIKMHFLHSHLDFFPPNLGEVSDEQGERFHQGTSVIEERCQGRFDVNIMGDFWWYLQRESKGSSCKRKAKCIKYF